MERFSATIRRIFQKFRILISRKALLQSQQPQVTESHELKPFTRSHSHSLDQQEDSAVHEASQYVSAVERPQVSDTAQHNEENFHLEVSPLRAPISQIVLDGISRLRPARGDTIVLNDNGTDLPIMLVSQRLIEAVNGYRNQERELAKLSSDSCYFSGARFGAQLALEAAEKKLSNETLSDEERGELEQKIREETQKVAVYAERKNAVDTSRAAKAAGRQRAQTEIINIVEFSLQTAGLRADTRTDTHTGGFTSPSLTAWDYNTINPSQHSNPLSLRASTLSPSPSSLFRRRALSAFSITQREFSRLEHQFARRHALYAEHLAEYSSAYHAGHTSMTMTDFDRVYLENIARLTRGLTTAEERYEAAFREARALGLIADNAEYQESNFVDRQSDGYAESFEQEMVTNCNGYFVQAWIEEVGLSEGEGEEEAVEVDEWEAREVRMSDSVSLIDYTRNRRRIDRWRRFVGGGSSGR